jgi:quercetin dioxygenase-like cupin family protein
MKHMENKRRFYNAVQKDYATLLKTADETQGELTLIEVELAPQGGNPLHTHSEFSEEFEVLEGELNVQVGNEFKVLKAGEKALVPPHTNHRFFSTSDEPTRFLVSLRPGHPGFEKAIQIAYGLATDDEKALNNPLILAHMVQMSGTIPVGIFALLRPVFGLLAGIAHNRGIDQRLAEKYLQPL